MTAESVIRRTKLPALAAALALAAPSAFAEDGITNIISGTTVTNNGAYNVGSNGSFNALVLTNAGVLRVTGAGIIGNSTTSSNNNAIVTGAGSLWSNSSHVYVGSNGSFNHLTIANGGKIASAAALVGFDSSSSNNGVLLTGTDSTWSPWAVYVGMHGTRNQFAISNGGTVMSGDVTIGYYAGANNNTVTVSSTGSILNSSGDFNVGYAGSGNQLTIASGSRVFNSFGYSGYIGNQAGANNNAVLVTGAGSVWSNSFYCYVGNSGSSNQLTIANGGIVFDSAGGFIGSASGANSNAVLVTGAGSLWNHVSYLNVGYYGSYNQLTIASGGTVSNTYGHIGFYSGANSNAVLVTGAGSTWNNSADLYVGNWGSINQLTISNGGLVINAGPSYIGYFPGSKSNAVLVTGVGSAWNSGSPLWVGFQGSGNQLTITNGGMVFDTGGGYLGYYASASNNSMLIAGAGSIWSNRYNIFVGYNGSGNQLTIANSGKVFNAGVSYIGGYVGGSSSPNSNVVLVTGAGSMWSNSSDFYVGYGGSFNQLTITNSGSVFNDNGYIGNQASASNNAVLVIGTGTVWSNSSTLYVGYSGFSNNLTIANNGAVAATNVVIGYNASTGNSITISGGNLYATNTAGNGALDVRRGTLALNSGTVAVNQLYLTNNANSIMTFSAGLLQSGGSTVSNGVVFTVGDGVQSATLDLLGGTHTFANGLKLNTNASLIGNGGIFGNVTNFSIIAPGHSVGVINITGGLTLQGTAELDMELAGPGTNDVLDISGLLAASGGLRVTFANGYTGNPGDTFDLLNFGSLSGAFSQTNLPALAGGLYWNTSNLYTLGQIAIAGVPEPGVSTLLALGVAMLARRRRR